MVNLLYGLQAALSCTLLSHLLELRSKSFRSLRILFSTLALLSSREDARSRIRISHHSSIRSKFLKVHKFSTDLKSFLLLLLSILSCDSALATRCSYRFRGLSLCVRFRKIYRRLDVSLRDSSRLLWSTCCLGLSVSYCNFQRYQ